MVRRRKRPWKQVVAKALVRGGLAALGGVTAGALLENVRAAEITIAISFVVATLLSLAEATERW